MGSGPLCLSGGGAQVCGAEAGAHSRDHRMDITRGLRGGDQTLSMVIPGDQVGVPEA